METIDKDNSSEWSNVLNRIIHESHKESEFADQKSVESEFGTLEWHDMMG